MTRPDPLGGRFPPPYRRVLILSVTAVPDYAMTDIGPIDRVSQGVVSPMPGALAGAA
jgi:hypothetical protein